jgi:cytochrome c-type biogenesis protein
MAGIGLALLAGVLTSLSPCVLPLVPIVIATALGGHRLGPWR